MVPSSSTPESSHDYSLTPGEKFDDEERADAATRSLQNHVASLIAQTTRSLPYSDVDTVSAAVGSRPSFKHRLSSKSSFGSSQLSQPLSSDKPAADLSSSGKGRLADLVVPRSERPPSLLPPSARVSALSRL